MKSASRGRNGGPANSDADSVAEGDRDGAEEERSDGMKDAKDKRNGEKGRKLVRDSFTFPAADHARLGELKQRALKCGREIKKSELLRAGLAALAEMPEAAFVSALDRVERIKTGRPGK